MIKSQSLNMPLLGKYICTSTLQNILYLPVHKGKKVKSLAFLSLEHPLILTVPYE